MLTHSGLKSALQGSIAVWIVSFFLTFSATVATANPNGGQVVAGDASISSQGNSLDINQNSQKAIIDWRSFNISQGEQTNFKQPSASALTLNRVRGGQLSQINGQLNANGQVFLINPQGVIFGPNAQVTTGGLVATTADIRNDDFISGNYQFDQASPNPNASIINQGHITTNDGGTIVLAAPTVNNEGTVQARLGNVNLASANTFTLDFHGDGLLSFEVQGQITQKPDSVSDDAALVNNNGTIIADGGTVTLTAQAADAVIDLVINMDGIIQATTLGEDKGKIILSGGEHGIVDVSGTLDVSGAENNETGGSVHVLGEKVGLFDGTLINAEGSAGGGEVLVGGNFQGKGPEANAKRTYVAKKATINASATKTGDGGKVIVWADETAQYYGDITARGGEQSGDGGFVEVSGKQNLGFNGTVAVDSLQGQSGSVLLDPTNIEIVATNSNNDEDTEIDNGQVSDNSIFFNDIVAEDLTISAGMLETLTGSIVLQALQDITINGELNLDNQINGDSAVFQAGNDISVNSSIITGGAHVVLEANSPHSSSISDENGKILFAPGKNITSHGGSVTLIGLDQFPSTGTITAGAGNINISNTELFLVNFNDLMNLHTNGILTFGQATTAGINGLGLKSEVLTANNIFLTKGSIQSSAQTTVILALQNIGSINKNFGGINVSLDRNVTLRAGNNVTLSSNFAALVTLDKGNFVAEADSNFFSTGEDGLGSLVLQSPFTSTFDSSMILAGEQIQIAAPIATGNGNITIISNSLVLGFPSIGAPLPANSISAGGILTIQPKKPTFDLGLGTAAAGLDINQQALDVFADGFSLMTFGRTDGEHNIEVANVTFRDPVKFLTSKGDVNVSGFVKTSDIVTFDTLGNVSAENANNDFSSVIINNANDVLLTDVNAIDLGRSIINGVLKVNANGNITSSDSLSVAKEASLSAGTGVIDLINPANNIAGTLTLSNIRNNNVNVVNNAPLILGTSNVGNGQLNITGTRISQTGAISQEAGAAATSFSATTGAIDLTQNNDFTSTVSLNNIGANDISIVDINTLNLGESSIETGNFIITAGDLNIEGAVLNAGGSLTLQPFTLDQNMSINSSSGSFNLLSNDIANLEDGFSTITLGRSGLNGDVTVDTVTFTDPLEVLADGSDASITINGVLTGADNASITLNGSNATTTLNGNIITNGNPILINDALILGNPVISGNPIVLDTTAGGVSPGAGITFSGSVTGTNPLSVTAGTGVINLTNPANTITGSLTLNNYGNNNVNVVNNAPLILGTSNVGNGQFNITGTQISQTGAITQEAGAGVTSFSATTGAIDLTQDNDFTSTVSLNNIDANDINIVDINTLNLGASSIETGDFTVTAGDLNIVGAVTNAGGSLTLQPFTLDQNMSINSSSGSFILSSDDISNLEDGFSTITLGRPGLNGDVTVDTVTFTDPLEVLADGSDASITINGVLTGANNASITLNGSNATTTLNGNIITNGNPIVINDALILGNPVIPGGAIVLDTTAGGVSPEAGITFAGTVNGATPLTLSAGLNTGDIQFQRAVGLNTELGNVNVLSANNVSMGPRFLASDVSVNASRTILNDVSTNGQQLYSGDLRLINGTYDTGGGDFIVLGNTNVFGNTTVSTQGGEIRFDGSVDNITESSNLTFVLNASSTGAVNFGSALGENFPLGELIITGSTINLQDVSTVKEETFFGISFNGNQQYNGTVTLNNDYNTSGGGFTVNGNTILGSNTTVSTTGGNIQLGNISGNTANNLILNAGLAGQILLTGINEPLLLNNPENDFIGTLNLTGTGTNNIDIFDSNLLQLGTSSIGANQFTLAAQELDIGGPLTTTDRGSLVFRPIDQAQSIGLGAEPGTFSLTQPEIDNIDNGFSSITIGSVGNTGNVIIDNAAFIDPLIIQADGTGATITVNGVLTGTDDASITLNGSGNTTFLNGNILTAGNLIIINDAVILGNTVLLDTTSSGAFAGAGITLNGSVNRGAALTPLTLRAGSNTGDILFTGDVGVNILLGDVTVLSANNITMNGRFLANDTSLTFSGLWQNNGNLPLDVNSLFVTPLAQGATVFGTVNSRGGLFAAPEVTGVSNDLRYTINGCVMGVFCGITGVPDTNIPDLPRADTDPLPVAKLELMNIWEQQKRLQDPRDERYSNLGNEELWWER